MLQFIMADRTFKISYRLEMEKHKLFVLYFVFVFQ
jgi:hypothetical protein